MSDYIPVITIDGPGASGKGSVAARVASQLGWHLLESGVLYRALVVFAEHKAIDLDDASALANIANHLELKFVSQEGDLPKVLLGDHDISVAVRSEMCGSLASKISQHKEVRQALFEAQRKFKKAPGLVAEGRDMGTVVFADAKHKFYLDATAENRALRRQKQLSYRGIDIDLDELLIEIKGRDHRDMTRVVAPLRPADGAVIINTNELPLNKVCEQILKSVK